LEGWPPMLFSLFQSISLLILPMVDFPTLVLDWIWHKEYPSWRREMTVECWAEDKGFMWWLKGKKMVEPISTCQTIINKVTWHCLLSPQVIPPWFRWLQHGYGWENWGSKNCPNDWLFCSIYYFISLDWNHMILAYSESYDSTLLYIGFSEYNTMMVLCCEPTSLK
jgi:hypothetical protein